MQVLESKQFKMLWQAKKEGRMPHAILLSGMAGVGKKAVAAYFSKALCCEQVSTDGKCCETCHCCHLVEGQSHPNLMWIQPDKLGHAIKVDQMREIREFVNQSSFMGKERIVIIYPADSMNVNAANALLKTLEEPASNAVIILVSDQNGPIQATILSRCHKIQFHQIPENQTYNDPERKDLYSGMLSLLNKKTDPVKLAQNLQEMSPLKLIDLSLSWIIDLIGLQLKTNVTSNDDYISELTDLSTKTELSSNVDFMSYLQRLRSDIGRGINFNKQLMVESLFVKWMDCLNVSR